MKFTLNTFVFLGGLLSAAATAAASEDSFPFTLRAWRDSRHGPPPPPWTVISHYVEIDPDTGNAIINKTESYPGFQSLLEPGPINSTLHRIEPYEKGYLVPLHDPKIPGKWPHYQLRYTSRIPKIAGVLYKTFTTAGRNCGGNCGGATLDYNVGGDRGFGEWYIYPFNSNNGRKVWTLRWIAITARWETPEFPDGAIPIYLWKN